MVKKEVFNSFDYAFHTVEGDNIIVNKKRDVRDIQVGDIRYSEGDGRMLVEFSLICGDGDKVSSAIGLNRDEFGVYHGVWDFGGKHAVFEIK